MSDEWWVVEVEAKLASGELEYRKHKMDVRRVLHVSERLPSEDQICFVLTNHPKPEYWLVKRGYDALNDEVVRARTLADEGGPTFVEVEDVAGG